MLRPPDQSGPGLRRVVQPGGVGAAGESGGAADVGGVILGDMDGERAKKLRGVCKNIEPG